MGKSVELVPLTVGENVRATYKQVGGKWKGEGIANPITFVFMVMDNIND